MGIITQIVRNSHVDGPGLRTVVFMKGCPLKCSWCHNPETQDPRPELFFDIRRCINCGSCLAVCPDGAIVRDGDSRIDRMKCTNCMACANACPTNAMEQTGTEMSVEQITKIIEKDSILYKNSGGGTTFSGGEPLMQEAFLSEVLKRCKNNGIHTAVDTCGAVAWEKFDKVKADVDLFLYDIKHTSRKDVMGELVLENALKLAKSGERIWFRIPLVPDFTADDEEIAQIGSFIKTVDPAPECVCLLPFHRFPENKYQMLDRPADFTGVQEMTDQQIAKFQDILAIHSGQNVIIGG